MQVLTVERPFLPCKSRGHTTLARSSRQAALSPDQNGPEPDFFSGDGITRSASEKRGKGTDSRLELLGALLLRSYFLKTIFSKSEYDLTCFCNSVSAGHGSPVVGVSAFRCRRRKVPLAGRLGEALEAAFAVGAKRRKGRLE